LFFFLFVRCLLRRHAGKERNLARFPVVPLPLLLTALAAGVRFVIIDAALCFMLPKVSAPVALVFVRGRVIGIGLARQQVQQVLKWIATDRAGLTARFRATSPPASLAKSTLVILFLVFWHGLYYTKLVGMQARKGHFIFLYFLVA
jgi:hypothetical protein